MAAPEADRIAAVYRAYARDGAPEGRWSPANAGNRAIVAERQRVLAELLAGAGRPTLRGTRILEIGCGTGEVLASLTALGAEPERMCGVDLLPDLIATARRRHPALRFEVGNAERLDLPAGSFDLVLLFTVLTSILDDGMARHLVREVDRLLVPGGAVVWYDFRFDNPWNRHVRGVGRRAIGSLFVDYGMHMRSVTVLPPLARRLGRTTSWAYPALARLPLLRTHYLGLLRKPG